MSAPELKPCPFCGGEAALTNREMPGCAFVICMGCQAQGDDGSIERVAAKWNTRADLCTPTDERVKALEAENARLRIALQQIVGGEIYTAADGFSKPHEPEQSRIARAALRDMGEG